MRCLSFCLSHFCAYIHTLVVPLHLTRVIILFALNCTIQLRVVRPLLRINKTKHAQIYSELEQLKTKVTRLPIFAFINSAKDNIVFWLYFQDQTRTAEFDYNSRSRSVKRYNYNIFEYLERISLQVSIWRQFVFLYLKKGIYSIIFFCLPFFDILYESIIFFITI